MVDINLLGENTRQYIKTYQRATKYSIKGSEERTRKGNREANIRENGRKQLKGELLKNISRCVRTIKNDYKINTKLHSPGNRAWENERLSKSF